jgi:hypothetical protein
LKKIFSFFLILTVFFVKLFFAIFFVFFNSCFQITLMVNKVLALYCPLVVGFASLQSLLQEDFLSAAALQLCSFAALFTRKGACEATPDVMALSCVEALSKVQISECSFPKALWEPSK